MKTIIRSRILSFVAAMLFTVIYLAGPTGYEAYAASTGPEILITEVMPMSQSGDDAYEYIELYNNSDNSINLKDYKLPLQGIDFTASKVIPSKGILIICTSSNTTLAEFNAFYGKSITENKYTTLPSLHDILDNSSAESIIISRDNNIVTVGASYDEDDIAVKRSVNYKYPASGFEMNKLSVKQAPTPGSVESTQVPDNGVRVTGVTLDKDIITMEINQSAVLYATVTPATAADKSLIWTSDNPDVVRVNQRGVLTAIREGDALITVKTVDGGYSAACEVIVGRVPVTKVELNKHSITLEAGQAIFLTASITPKNATNKKVSWTSNRSAVATVNQNGMVTAKSEGTAVITVKTEDGNYTATCTVKVNNDDDNVRVTGVTLNETAATLKTGEVMVLEAQVSPYNAANKNVTWSSSKPSVASVDKNGVVYGHIEGQSLITVRTSDGGYTASCLITVADEAEDNEEVTSFRLNKDMISLKVGKSHRIVPIFCPGNIKGTEITWESEDSDIAMVTSDGWVMGLKEGYTTITATAYTKDGECSDTCAVYVRRHDNGKSKWDENQKTKEQGRRK